MGNLAGERSFAANSPGFAANSREFADCSPKFFPREHWRTIGEHSANSREHWRSSREFARSSPRTGEQFARKTFLFDVLKLFGEHRRTTVRREHRFAANIGSPRTSSLEVRRERVRQSANLSSPTVKFCFSERLSAANDCSPPANNCSPETGF